MTDKSEESFPPRVWLMGCYMERLATPRADGMAVEVPAFSKDTGDGDKFEHDTEYLSMQEHNAEIGTLKARISGLSDELEDTKEANHNLLANHDALNVQLQDTIVRLKHTEQQLAMAVEALENAEKMKLHLAHLHANVSQAAFDTTQTTAQSTQRTYCKNLPPS